MVPRSFTALPTRAGRYLTLSTPNRSLATCGIRLTVWNRSMYAATGDRVDCGAERGAIHSARSMRPTSPAASGRPEARTTALAPDCRREQHGGESTMQRVESMIRVSGDEPAPPYRGGAGRIGVGPAAQMCKCLSI
jgi:hypothetical protein